MACKKFYRRNITKFTKFAMHSGETYEYNLVVRKLLQKFKLFRTLDKKQHVDTCEFGWWPDIFRLETDIAGRTDHSLAILAAM